MSTAVDLRYGLADAMELVAIDEELSHEVAARAAAAIVDALDDRLSREDMADRLTASLKDCCRFQRMRAQKTRALCARLDELARAAQRAEHSPAEPHPLAVTQIVRALRDPLATLSDAGAYDAATVISASEAVQSVIAQVPTTKLLSESVRKNLGGKRHALLRALLEADDGAAGMVAGEIPARGRGSLHETPAAPRQEALA